MLVLFLRIFVSIRDSDLYSWGIHWSSFFPVMSLIWFRYQGNIDPLTKMLGSLPFSSTLESLWRTGADSFFCFIKFTSEAIWSWVFFKTVFWLLVQMLYLLKINSDFPFLLTNHQISLVVCIFQEICPFHRGYLICWHRTIQSIPLQSFCFCKISLNVPSLFPEFSYLNLLFLGQSS